MKMLKLTHNPSIITPLCLLLALCLIYMFFSTHPEPALATDEERVYICHFDNQDEEPVGHVIEVSGNAVQKHIDNHGDCELVAVGGVGNECECDDGELPCDPEPPCGEPLEPPCVVVP